MRNHFNSVTILLTALLTALFVAVPIGPVGAEIITAKGGVQEGRLNVFALRGQSLEPETDQRLIELGEEFIAKGFGQRTAVTNEWFLEIKPTKAEIEAFFRAARENELERLSSIPRGNRFKRIPIQRNLARIERTFDKLTTGIQLGTIKLEQVTFKGTLADAKENSAIAEMISRRIPQNEALRDARFAFRGMSATYSLDATTAFGRALRNAKLLSFTRRAGKGLTALAAGAAVGGVLYWIGYDSESDVGGPAIPLPPPFPGYKTDLDARTLETGAK